ncbi:MAG: hypothetical protein NTY36_16085 [Deltaproteobacteria bacterium]|nr:hypothetical protein [Deltaproteobacteria bacterium]
MKGRLPRSVVITGMVLATAISLLAGCATMRYAGAPEPSFNINDDIKELSLCFEGSTSITKFYGNPSEQARDEFIVGRLTLMNLRYLKFIRNLTSERQLLDSATAITAMGLGLAGSMVPLAQTTKILASVSAGVAGTKEVIDKNYYFEKTIPALVAQMNAERQKALTPILEGMQKDIKQYPLGKAVVDLNNYYIAGTFAGAIQSIQVDAGKKEEEQKVVNRRLTMPTPEQKAAHTILKAYFAKKYLEYHKDQVKEIDKLKKALKNLGKADADIPPDKEIIKYLHGLWDATNDVEILNALKAASVSIN